MLGIRLSLNSAKPRQHQRTPKPYLKPKQLIYLFEDLYMGFMIRNPKTVGVLGGPGKVPQQPRQRFGM